MYVCKFKKLNVTNAKKDWPLLVFDIFVKSDRHIYTEWVTFPLWTAPLLCIDEGQQKLWYMVYQTCYLKQKLGGQNQPPFLKATIFLTSLVGLSWKRQLEHLLTKLPQNPTSAHIGPGKKHLLTWPQNPTSAAFHLLSSQTASSTRCLASTTSEYINIKSLFGSLQM